MVICDFLADLLFFQHIQVNRLDFNAWKCWQMCHYIELSEYKLYMGHIHTLTVSLNQNGLPCYPKYWAIAQVNKIETAIQPCYLT